MLRHSRDKLVSGLSADLRGKLSFSPIIQISEKDRKDRFVPEREEG